MTKKEQYLQELISARQKYMVSDFPKYLQECNRIDAKYNYSPYDEMKED